MEALFSSHLRIFGYMIQWGMGYLINNRIS